jgi:tRNA acetyltransferase TAN1
MREAAILIDPVFYVNVLPPLDPVRLVQNMLSTVEISAQSAFKFVKRLVPISATSAATMAQLGQICTDVVKEGFKTYDNRALKVC